MLLAPAAALWSATLAAQGAATAIRVGMLVRRAPVLRSAPTLIAGGPLTPVCTLISDTHVVAPGRMPSELVHEPHQWATPELPTCDQIDARLRRVLQAIKQAAPETVIWCGDEVDTGDPREWAGWQRIVDAVPGLAHRLIPGNHDICFNRPYDEDYALARRAVRERAYQRHAGPLGEFPIADTIISDAGPVNVVLLDSCRHRSKHVLSNAIGHYGDVQLDELARVLRDRHGPLLCISHHHVWRDARFLEPESWYNTAVDADQLCAILGSYRRADPANHVMVCHGHRHTLTAGVIGDRDAEISVVGLPSSTLGNKTLRSGTLVLDGKLRYAVAGLRRDGSWGVTLHEVGSAERVADK